MIAIDSSSLVSYFAGGNGPDVDAVEAALVTRQAILPPVVITEILSAENPPDIFSAILSSLPKYELLDGFWIRAGELRRLALKKGYKAKLADILIAQFCVDYKLRLITRDLDFKNLQKISTLKLEV